MAGIETGIDGATIRTLKPLSRARGLSPGTPTFGDRCALRDIDFAASRSPFDPRAPGLPHEDFPAVIDLTGLAASAGFVIRGDAASDYAGFSVADAGDVNGDGFGDVIVGAAFGENGETDTGEAYVIFGKASGFGTVDLSALGSAGFRIVGDAASDLAGWSVSGAGDVNGDGFDDVVVGARAGDDGGSAAGEAYVIFGKASLAGTVDLSSLGTKGFIIKGDAANDQAGISVSAAGDVNSDGFDDVIVGASTGDDGGLDAGEAYVIFGKAGGFGTIDLTSLGAKGFIIKGDMPADNAGISVSDAGDVNGDGFDDIVVGATGGDDGGTQAGEAYVILGKAGGFGTIDLSALGAAGFIIRGDAAYDLAGKSVSSAGDVNGDGFDDLVIGALLGDDGGASAGEAYVVFGKAGGFADIDLGALGAAGFVIRGDAAGDQAGISVSSAGDVDGDGFDDVIIGANYGDDGGDKAGEAYVIFGKASGFGTIDLSSIGAAGFIIQGDAVNDQAGFSVSGAGDVNGDGFADMIVGAPGGDDGGANAGEAYVIFGKAPAAAVNRTGAAGGQVIRGGAFDDTLSGVGGDDTLDGGGGVDRLKGGKGKDSFTLDSADTADADRLSDFDPAKDLIALDGDVFGFPEGALAANRFVVGNAAQDANDRLIYNDANGKLFFDADGTGGAAQVLIATLTGAPNLAAADFVVI